MINTIIEGSFSVQVFRNGKERLSLPRTKNLITRGGMNLLAIFGDTLHVGTGGTTPTFADTSLEAFLVASNESNWSTNTPILTGTDYLKESQNTYTFNVGAVVGNISELGVAVNDSQVPDIQTRALFKDGIGDPTTITVTVDDQLVVTYFVKKTISMIPVVTSILADVDGVPTTIDYTIRPCIASSADAGSSASYPASLIQTASNTNSYIRVNTTNFATITGPDYIPAQLSSGGESSVESTASVVLTGAGNEVTHNYFMPITTGNFQWVCMGIMTGTSGSSTTMFLQIEFDGPNYITKTASDSVTFKLKETMNQVIV